MYTKRNRDKTWKEANMFTNNLVKLRKEAGLSQQDLADKLGVARATYNAFETGKSSPHLLQVFKLAEFFEVAPETLIADVQPDQAKTSKVVFKEVKEEIVPREVVKEKLDILREVLLYVLDKVGAKPNVGETVIYKLLYFIDFDFYEKTGKSITGLTYVRNHYGPTPQQQTFKGVVSAMKKKKELEVIDTKFFKHLQKKYLPVTKPNLSMLSAEELQHIDEVLARLSDKTASELSALSHRDMPWLATKDKQPISYQLAKYRTTETSVKEPEDEL